MRKQIILLLILVIIQAACGQGDGAQKIQSNATGPEAAVKMIEVNAPDIDDNGVEVSRTVSVGFSETPAGTIKYSNIAAANYAQQYASQKTNSCGVFIYDEDTSKKRSDCSHFIAHCLKAGGIEVKNTDPALKLCPHGLSFRATEIIASLTQLDQQYENVQQIAITDAIVYDYGFLGRLDVMRPSHAFMVCKPAANADDFQVYAHTAARNCEKMSVSWIHYFDVAFRMVDAQ